MIYMIGNQEMMELMMEELKDYQIPESIMETMRERLEVLEGHYNVREYPFLLGGYVFLHLIEETETGAYKKLCNNMKLVDGKEEYTDEIYSDDFRSFSEKLFIVAQDYGVVVIEEHVNNL